MTILNMNKDIKGINTFGLTPCDDKYNTTLTAAGGEQHMAVPNTAKKWLAIFAIEPGCVVWIGVNQTATLPGGSFAIATAEMNPVSLEVNSGDIISVITAETSCVFGVKFYAIQQY